jgi:GNAT superfamily N-acetyltransferase
MKTSSDEADKIEKFVRIIAAKIEDVPTILQLVTELARYEKLEHEVVASLEDYERNLFGPQRFAEVLLLEESGVKVGFALFFYNFSTFLGKPGIYLEDLYIQPHCRGRGYGKRLLT